MKIIVRPQIVHPTQAEGETEQKPGVMSAFFSIALDDADLREIFPCGADGGDGDALFAKVFRDFCTRPASEWAEIYGEMAERREDAAKLAKKLSISLGQPEAKAPATR